MLLKCIVVATALVYCSTTCACFQYKPQSSDFDFCLNKHYKCKLCHNTQVILRCKSENCTSPPELFNMDLYCTTYLDYEACQIQCRKFCCHGAMVQCFNEIQYQMYQKKFIQIGENVISIIILTVIYFSLLNSVRDFFCLCAIIRDIFHKIRNFIKKHTQIIRFQSYYSLSNDVCSICLLDKLNIIIPCGHSYHLHCFILWIQNKPQCPLCRQTMIHHIRVYCEGCQEFFIQVDIQNRSTIQDVQQLLEKIQCNLCNKRILIGAYSPSAQNRQSDQVQLLQYI